MCIISRPINKLIHWTLAPIAVSFRNEQSWWSVAGNKRNQIAWPAVSVVDLFRVHPISISVIRQRNWSVDALQLSVISEYNAVINTLFPFMRALHSAWVPFQGITLTTSYKNADSNLESCDKICRRMVHRLFLALGHKAILVNGVSVNFKRK